MKKGLLFIVFICCSLASFAAHIKGGWIYYEYQGQGSDPTKLKYKITVKVYRDCGGGSTDPTNPQNDATINISVYSGTSNTFITNIPANRTSLYTLQKQVPNPCMSNPPSVCYRILMYEAIVELAPSAAGYTLDFQRCCRISGIQNLQAPSDTWGNTYATFIPGTTLGATAPQNSTPAFVERDTAIICYKAPYKLDYQATDAEGDSLVYSICAALHGGSQGTPAPNPSGPPPFAPVSYGGSYSGAKPFGTDILISNTGQITGTAPDVPGEYVISVCVSEYRNGILLGVTRKELHVIVGNCTLAGAELNPSYITCGDFSFSFQNESTSAGVTDYAWTFGDPLSGANNTSSQPTPTHTFTDTGKFIVKLKVTNNLGCQDSAQTVMSVYPTFKTDFSFSGNCFQSPFQFTDGTTHTYGTVNKWHWDFGETTLTDDTSNIKNPSYKYNSAGTRTVTLISQSDKGCIDTISKPVLVRANPVLDLPFKDTLICSIDQLPLIAQGTGNFNWISQPTDPSLTTPNIPNPVVAPKDTTLYIVTLNDNGCVKTDTITVNVLDFITVDIGADTGICRTDTIVMKTVSHALSYQWTPATGLSSTAAKAPQVFPNVTTTYYVQANLGLCPAYDTITIQVAPYPVANAGADAMICYGDRVQLHANYNGTGYAWSPTNSLLNPTSLNPIAGPQTTTAYIFTAFSQGICPKPRSDTAWVVVRSQVKAFAGNDTAVTALQPLQLNATGGVTYQWSPSFGLSATNIGNPVATLPFTVDSIIYRVRATDSAGCFADDDMKVIVFKTGADIFIPTAFTPNGDGTNEIARPVLVGMQQLVYYRVFNRWGQMVYSTSEIGKGWDGTFGGKKQPSGTYVFAAQAIDYTGKPVFKKGTLVLIR
jgi:gliding motility-associated-like protein